MNLLTVGFIAAGGAAISYFSGADDEVDSLGDALKAHEGTIRSLREAYGDAANGLATYADASREVLGAATRQNLSVLQAQLRAEAQSLADQLTKTFSETDFLGNLTSTFTDIAPEFEKLRGPIENFRMSVAAGKPDVDALAAALEEIVAKDPSLRSLADTILLKAQTLDQVDKAAAAAAIAVDKFGSASGSAIGNVSALAGAAQGLQKALDALNGIALPTLDDQAKALSEYNKALESAVTEADVRRADDALRAAQVRIQTKNTPIPGFNPRRDLTTETEPSRARGGGGGRKSKPRDDYEDFKKRIAEQTQALGLQSQALQDFGGKADLARLYTEGLIAAQREGKPITEDLKNEVAGLVQKYGEGQVPIDQFKESQRDLNEAMAEINDTARSALGGFISDLRNGASAGEALKRVMDQLVDRSLDLVLDGLFPSAPNKDGSWGGLFGGLFKGLLGFADGGRPPVGRPSWVGERGRELFVPDTAGTIIPNHMLGGGGASPVIINADFRGAEAGAVTAINAKLEQLRSSIPSMIDFRARQAQVRGSRA